MNITNPGRKALYAGIAVFALVAVNGSVPSTVMNMGGTSVPFMFNTPLPTATNK